MHASHLHPLLFRPEHLATRAIHGGLEPDPSTGAILTPIHQSTTYVQEAVGRDKGFTYTRAGNPTVAALERNLGQLEDALPALAFSTGMAAITALCLAVLRAGDRVVVGRVVYGGTVQLLRHVLGPFGVRLELVDPTDPERLRDALRDETRLVIVESPGNPTLELTDIAAAAEAAHAAGAVLAVDNTLLTPVLQTPLELGADVVLHSTTKYIEGHNATVGGALVSRDPELLERVAVVRKSVGFPQAPFEAWLTLRGIKTLPVRMARHSENAAVVAEFLEGHPAVRRVAYPWLESFPQHALARRQQRAGGGMISFEVHGGTEAGIGVMNAVRLCSLAENLGAVETLVTHPTSMTHWALTPEERRSAGISDGLVRLSVGLEDPGAIIEDLDLALASVEAAR